jgi:hypothetical protein
MIKLWNTEYLNTLSSIIDITADDEMCAFFEFDGKQKHANTKFTLLISTYLTNYL